MTIVRLPAKNKYHNKPGREDGLRFDSQREILRYRELKALQASGAIDKLVADKKLLRFPLKVNGALICTYVADFEYQEKFGGMVWARIVEDCKSEPTKTTAYKIKKKLLRAIYGIEIREV